MEIYTFLTVPAAILAFLLIALLTKKADNVIYGTLDKVGRITNIVLVPLYIVSAPFTLLLGSIARPYYDGILGIIGWIISILIASSVLFSGVGLGLSVALRKRGKSVPSFIVQFAGIAGIAISVGLYGLTAGNLLCTLN